MCGDFKRNGRVTFHFRTVFEMALGVQNWFADPLGFRIACETVLGVRNFLHALQKFCKVFEMIS